MMITLVLAGLIQAASAPAAPAPAASVSDPLPEDWVAIPDDEVMVVTLAGGGTVAVRLAPASAPVHVDNIRRLAAARWWDAGASVYRVQDNYVAQWGDATEKKPLPPGIVANPPAEYDHAGTTAVAKLTKPDPYAPWAGYSRDGWPLAGNATTEWVPHCYGMVGVARDLAPSTGSGGDLYAAIGHGPRALDRNVAIVGRVVEGIERLSALPRGTGDLGFYKTPGEQVAITSVRLASEIPAAERPRFQYRRTDNPRFTTWITTRENRAPPFFVVPAGGADICNALPPVRRAPAG
ncbi:peptidylprolyl isomerase [Sphingomonas sp. Leaf339]|uniref:peptidylprolyl isomerase n=1 Tax=Sphingomonas sp. Leaf339 TaxID=1736343 RepID=UPI0006FA42EA|nr:peptidylprolyl isomerase [Sphingomonas sp. Leaf339]KQU48128.1 peptidylprolyl isomerase [Sphingomonas sp. Leaf339]